MALKSNRAKDGTLLVGYYGQHNTGDDAFLAVAAWGARKYLGAEDIWATARTMPQTYGIPVRPALFPWQFRGCGIAEKIRLRRLLPQIRHVVFGGGSNFHSAAHIERFIQMIRAAGKGPHFAVGISAGPFREPGAEKAFAQLCSLLSFVGVRDAASLERVRRIAPDVHAELTFDLAPLLPLAAGIKGAPDGRCRKGLGVAVCNYERFVSGELANERKRIRTIAEAVGSLAMGGALEEVVLLDFNGDAATGDGEVNRILAAELEEHVRVRRVLYSENPLKMLVEIARLRGILAMRLHAAVFAFCVNTPALILSYHEKCRQWARMVGHPAELVLEATDLAVDDLMAGLGRICENGDALPKLDSKRALDSSLKNWTWLTL